MSIRLLPSKQWAGEYFCYHPENRDVIYYRLSGPLPVGEYILLLATGKIHCIDGVNYTVTRTMKDLIIKDSK